MPQPATWFPAESSRNGNDDDDIVVDQEIQSLKCPITLTLLENPVRNTKCPHVYSLDAITELLRLGRGICRCPVAGCQASVTKNDLREDKAMARKVREEKAREEERAAEMSREFQEVTETDIMMEDEDDEVKLE